MKMVNCNSNNSNNNTVDHQDREYSLSSFSGLEKQALYKAIFSRRDVRSHFVVDKKIPNDILRRILDAAHHAPSVGFSQPWNFIVIKDKSTRQQVKSSFLREHKRSISMLDEDAAAHGHSDDRTQRLQRKEKYLSLKLEGIMESAVNICVTYDSTRFGPFVLGRTSIPETGIYSVCCAIQNLWLAARAEGIGVGWVSIISNEDLRLILDIPPHVQPIAYLSLGYVKEFADKPDLENAGWLPRLELHKVVSYERWGCESSKDNIFS
jgi:5,6-dimethylbenzimidazole synthase